MAASAKKRKASKKRKQYGRIGVEIFEQVERMVADQKLNRTDAFKRLSAKSGRQLGTVAANYYRVAHQRGVELRKRKRRGPGWSAGPQSRSVANGRVVLNRALAAIQEVTALVRRQEAELAKLRKEKARFAEVRRLVGSV